MSYVKAVFCFFEAPFCSHGTLFFLFCVTLVKNCNEEHSDLHSRLLNCTKVDLK